MDILADNHWSLVSIFLHIIFAFFIGGFVLFKALPEPPDFVSEGGFLAESPENDVPPGPTNADPLAQMVPDMATLAPNAPAAVMAPIFTTSAMPLDFEVPVATTGISAMATEMAASAAAQAGKAAAASAGGGMGKSVGKGYGVLTKLQSPFGNKESTDMALEGRLFDFKRTASGEGQNPHEMATKVRAFLDGGWKFESLDDVFEVPGRVYTTQIITPYIEAVAAPAAFGVEKSMQPSYWAVIYTGTVIPPKTGRYRFIGVADDILAVAVNGKTVLIGSVHSSDFAKNSAWQPTSEKPVPAPGAPAGPMIFGDWVDLKEGQSITLQVLVSEVPGGGFAAWLLWEREGKKPPKREDGTPEYPVFQMAKLKGDPVVDQTPHSWGNEFWAPETAR